MRKQAAIAGVSPLDYDQMTLAEVMDCIDAYHEREKNSLIGRINAILRALGTKKGESPYDGLDVADKKSKRRSLTMKQAAEHAFWRY